MNYFFKYGFNNKNLRYNIDRVSLKGYNYFKETSIMLVFRVSLLRLISLPKLCCLRNLRQKRSKSNAMVTLATMLDYAVNSNHENIDVIFKKFIDSGYSSIFEKGDPAIITGKSGVELYTVCEYHGN